MNRMQVGTLNIYPIQGWRGLSLGLMLIAFVPRVQDLAMRSLSYAEGVSLYYTLWPLPVMLAFVGTSEHGPLYSLLLAGWAALAGRSEFALRFLSVWPSVVTVALVLALVRGLWRPQRIGFAPSALAYACALVVALLPAQWRVAREAVPYAWATMWLVLAAYLLVKLLRNRGPGSVALTNQAAGPATLGTGISEAKAARWRLAAAFALACIGAVYTDPVAWLAVAGFWLAALVRSVWTGAWDPWRSVTAGVLAALVAFVPWLSVAGPWWQSHLTAVRGGAAVTATDLAGELEALFARRGGLVDSDRPDFRALVGYMRHHAMPNEAVVLVGGHSFPMFQYYAADRWDTYPLPARLIPAEPKPLDAAQVSARLNRMVEDGHRVVWLILWQAQVSDPEGLTLALLAGKGEPISVDERFGGLEVRRFELPKGTVFQSEMKVRP